MIAGLVIAAVAVVAAVVSGSPALGVAGFGYAMVIRHMLTRLRTQRAAARRRVEALDRLTGIAADLRAGSVIPLFALADRDLDRYARAAWRSSNRTGAPLADLLDRLEAHQRRLWRIDDAAHAQTAGIRVTTLLLIALPPVALAVAEAVGIGALRVLLHTRLGLACTVGAFVLQLAGMAWAARIARPRPDRLPGEFAVAAELMAASLRAGSPVPTAVLATGDVLEGPLAACLSQIGRELAAGVAPDQAWQRLYVIEPARGVLARLLLGPQRFGAAHRVVSAARRSAESGAAMAGALTRCADDVRADLAHDREAQVQRASVLLVLPLGLCFLPAFLLAGMVPALFAVLGEILG